MVSVIIVWDFERGVPKSVSWISDMAIFLLFRGLQARMCRDKVFPEMLQRAHDRVGGEAAQRAQRAELHGVAEVVDEFDECDAERDLEKSAAFDVAGELNRHRAARAAHAEIGVGFGAAGEDEGDCRE